MSEIISDANRGKRVVLAMSGGVDSSVAAWLLKEQGYDVVGLFMRTGSHSEDYERRTKTCCSITDSLDAQRVADRLGIPFFALDFENDFGRIVDYFVDEYFQGRTPNPCVMCNIWLKFGKLWAYGQKIGADYVATGHYARIIKDSAEHKRIARGLDVTKDQSYVLSGLKKNVLEKILFPVGHFPKSKIREMARDLSLPVHSKPDSQEICFIPDNDYVRFVREQVPERETAGTFVDKTGITIGHHEGFEGFTVGQRKGIGIAAPNPLYVLEIRPESNSVVIGDRDDLLKSGLIAQRLGRHIPPPPGAIKCHAQIRSRHTAVSSVAWCKSGESGTVYVRFDTPQPAVTPGQVLTLYENDMVLGGGWIESATDSLD
ncbi:MAG: tRNA 2-thiouridine(34) synthase MnmA, partial [bacterium]